MAYGDKAELNFDGVYRITTNGGTDVVLSPAAEEGRTTPGAGGIGAAEPAITTIDLNGGGALMPAANGPERYQVTIRRLR
jgi:hypothetical protein